MLNKKNLKSTIGDDTLEKSTSVQTLMREKRKLHPLRDYVNASRLRDNGYIYVARVSTVCSW
jgi:hypothetical protein